MALNFWMLEITGSTALMGMLSAVTMLPKIILGPFAGVFVDRWDRKKLIVLTDLIRGVIVTFVGIAGVMGFIQVWMVFIVGIISGICAAFFNPAINSSRPDIVPEDKLLKANSVTSLAQSGMDMIGNAVGGVLYVLIGAPYMFLLNGISYLFSAFTEIFESYGVKKVIYGHLHGHGLSKVVNGTKNNVEYIITSSDYLNFNPLKILD